MKYCLLYIAICFFLFSCNNAKKEPACKSLEEYRATAAAADQEALRLYNIRTAIEEESYIIDSIFFDDFDNQQYQAKIDSTQHLLDSIDALIKVQNEIMNRCSHECDSIYHTWAL